MSGASAPAMATSVLDGSLWSSLLVTALALAFVLALAWLFLHLLKRATALGSANGSTPPQVVQAVSLGARERLVVVRHGSHEYVLGVTAASINLIDKQPAASGSACAPAQNHSA